MEKKNEVVDDAIPGFVIKLLKKYNKSCLENFYS